MFWWGRKGGAVLCGGGLIDGSGYEGSGARKGGRLGRGRELGVHLRRCLGVS